VPGFELAAATQAHFVRFRRPRGVRSCGSRAPAALPLKPPTVTIPAIALRGLTVSVLAGGVRVGGEARLRLKRYAGRDKKFGWWSDAVSNDTGVDKEGSSSLEAALASRPQEARREWARALSRSTA